MGWQEMIEKKVSLAEQHKKLMKNPELPEEHHAAAFKHNEGINVEAETIIKVNEVGLPIEKIDPEAYANDYAGFWRLHERGLWSITGACLLYLALKLFGV
jgi:hypothetical protein